MPTISEQLTQLISDRDDLVDNLTTKGITGLTGDETFTELVPEVLNIPSGETPVFVLVKDVNFYDYNGTRLYSYTLSEIQELAELPALPSHTGLTCQGWNWTLADIKAENKETDVGAMYITDDEKTRLYIKIAAKSRMTVPLCFRQSVANGVEVDWGDGSAVETFAESGTTNILPTHTYSTIGDYVITLNPLNDCVLTLGNGSTSYCIMGSTTNANKVYQNMLCKIEIGKNVTSISQNAFRTCYSLSTITIPNSVTTLGNTCFYSCTSLSTVIIPSSVTSVENYTIGGCSALSIVSIPKTVTNLGNQFFYNCSALSKTTIPSTITNLGYQGFYCCYVLANVVIPNGVTSIANQCFYACYGIAYYDFSNFSAIPALADTNAFTGIADDCKIIVPDSLYEDWIVATNWSIYASYIIKKTDWEAL